MTSFLFKINRAKDVTDPSTGRLQPDKRYWEDCEVAIPLAGPVWPTGTDRGAPPQIAPGDEIWIWTHTHKKAGAGWGLTATARAGAVRMSTAQIVRLFDVRLLDAPFDFPWAEKAGALPPVLRTAKDYRGARAYVLGDEDRDGLRALVTAHDDAQRRAPGPSMADSGAPYLPQRPSMRAIEAHREQIVRDFQARRQGTFKPRPLQARFRADLLDLYPGCVVTGCTLPDACEAAHIIAHTGDPVWDDPANGLLLRRDMHALFDRIQWSIHPGSGRLVLGERMKGTDYSMYSGMTVRHHANSDYLGIHWHQFRKHEGR